jgi:hypothetical protein
VGRAHGVHQDGRAGHTMTGSPPGC